MINYVVLNSANQVLWIENKGNDPKYVDKYLITLISFLGYLISPLLLIQYNYVVVLVLLVAMHVEIMGNMVTGLEMEMGNVNVRLPHIDIIVIDNDRLEALVAVLLAFQVVVTVKASVLMQLMLERMLFLLKVRCYTYRYFKH